MDSAHTGETTLTLAGERVTLVYDWRALSALRTSLADDVMIALNSSDPVVLAKIVAIGLARHHPDWTAERVTDASPPMLPTVGVVVRAISRAFWGTEAPPSADPLPPAPAA